MSALSTDLLSLIRVRLEAAKPEQVIRIAAALIAEERIEGASIAASYSRPTMDTGTKPRFVNIGDDDNSAAAEHAWIYDRTTGLVWARSVLEGEFTWADAMKACEQVKFRGQACRAPTLVERFGINDYTKHSPALDTAHFKKEAGWEWTSTVDASSPSVCAWVVVLGGGYCDRDVQSFRYHVRPVLAGQSFNFTF